MCDLPAATLKLSSPPACKHSSFFCCLCPRLRDESFHFCAPLMYSLPVYIYRRSPSRLWPPSPTSPCLKAAGPMWSWTRRVWGDALTSAPESLALLHARHRCLWRHGCLLSGLGSRAAAISLPDRTTSSTTRSSSRSCRRRWRPGTFGMISYRVNPGIGCLPPVRCPTQGAPPPPRSWAARPRRRQGR